MRVLVENCIFLNGRAGEFERKENDEVVKVKYQNGEFYQDDEDGGGSITLSIASDIPITDFQRMKHYDLELDFRQTQTSGGGKRNNLRVVAWAIRD